MTAIPLASPAFTLALICAALMGYAIQRGGTCMVAAVEEVVVARRANKLIAMLEAGLWVAAGLLAARLAGGMELQSRGYATTAATIAGGALLGLGAFVNRSCVFGAIAKLGSGYWAYMFTPAGFFLGCLIAARFADQTPATPFVSPLLAAAPLAGVPMALFVAWRARQALLALHDRRFASYVWSPHMATTVIGLAFVAMYLSVGSWAYTETLEAMARGMASGLIAKLALSAGLMTGAIAGGWTAGLLHPVRPAFGSVLRCLCGGALMGLGSSLIPGSNDGLILIGLPLLQPYALVGLASMVTAILLGMKLESLFSNK